MTSIAKVRRRRTALMLAVNLVALAGLGGFVYAGAKALSHYSGARNAAKPSILTPSTPVALLGTVNADNVLTSVTLFVMRPVPQTGGSLVSIPVSADTSGGVGTKVSLAEAYKVGGAKALSQAVESTVGITVDASRVVDMDHLQALVKRIGTIHADLPDEVRTTSGGETVALYPAGKNSLSPFMWSTALNAQVTDETERTRRPTIEALWTGLATAVGTGKEAVDPALAKGSFDYIVNHVFAGSVGARGLPADPYAAGTTPVGSDVEQLDRPETILVMASIAPSAMSAPNPGLIYRLEAPKGSEAKVKYAISVILYLGGNVQSVYLDGPSQTDTLMYMYDQRFAEVTLNSLKVFGTVKSIPPDQRVDGVDVVLQFGSSFLTAPTSNTMPSTTSTLP